MGIYAYRVDVLLRWPQLPISPLEQLEKLEQLRLIEAGIRIDTLEVEGDQMLGGYPRASGAGAGHFGREKLVMGCWWFRTGRHGLATRGACYPFLLAVLYGATLL